MINSADFHQVKKKVDIAVIGAGESTIGML
jgi:hypothetical protein